MDELIAALQGDRSPNLYRLATPIEVETLTRLSEEYGWKCFYLDGTQIHDKAEFLQACAATMSFPDHFGHNWDAFEDCMRDLEAAPGTKVVLLFDRPEQFALNAPEQWETALNILQDAVEFWQATDTPLYVLFKPNLPLLDELDSL